MAREIPRRGEPIWEGLLKWSIANTDTVQQAPPREISESDRKWFNEAVQAHAIDVISRMKEISVILNTPQKDLDEQGVTPQEQEAMLEELQGYVESIDMATDLHAIGGLIPLLDYLKNPHASVRARAAEVVTTIVQNNPKSQQQVMDVNGLQLLLHTFFADEEMLVRVKALGAISSLIRHNKAGVTAFRLAKGFGGLLDALSSEHPRLQRKSLQVILYLMQENPKDAKEVDELGFALVLAELVGNPDGEIRQAALNVLVEMRKGGELVQGVDANWQLRDTLRGRIDQIKRISPEDQAALEEECCLINSLWQLSFGEPSSLIKCGLLGSAADEQKIGHTTVEQSNP